MKNMCKSSNKQFALESGQWFAYEHRQTSILNKMLFHALCFILIFNTFSIEKNLFVDSSSSENVYIRSSYGQLVTSSTLR